ncbi:MAG: DJ-1/PfpI family protein [Propionibacteriaceae bacterium]|jgi:transcriptional regulator GlxA family with amidase domain|nr:DJ-1/PfpI family protein [Propionibacteriaceae bacterium]
MTLTVGIYAFDGMELLDHAGPFQVFSTASRLAGEDGDSEIFSVVTLAASMDPVTARGGARILPDATNHDAPALDCLIIPGGHVGVDAQISGTDVVDWVRSQAEQVRILASVCTGAFILAAAGLLDGKKATTHAHYTDELRRRHPQVTVLENRRWVDEGSIITSAGMTAGIDMSLHLVERLANRDLSVATARQMEL